MILKFRNRKRLKGKNVNHDKANELILNFSDRYQYKKTKQNPAPIYKHRKPMERHIHYVHRSFPDRIIKHSIRHDFDFFKYIFHA